MSKKIPVHNSGDTVLPVGPYFVQPGDTRMIEEHFVPASLRPGEAPQEAPAEVDPVLDILDGSVPQVTEKLAGLSDPELQRLKQAEENGKTRQGVMKAIAEEELSRADAKAGSEDGSTDQGGGSALDSAD